jgi:UDP-glucuronate 4-epimerase
LYVLKLRFYNFQNSQNKQQLSFNVYLENKKCEIYNLGNSVPISLNRFIEICEKITNNKAIYKQINNQIGDVPHTYADITKAKRDLNYNPKVNLEEGLKKLYETL